MKVTGPDFIQAIINRISRRNEWPTDANIINEIERLSWQEVNRILLFGEDTPDFIPPTEEIHE